MLNKLVEFEVPVDDLILIYIFVYSAGTVLPGLAQLSPLPEPDRHRTDTKECPTKYSER